jgi:hypothetical protein
MADLVAESFDLDSGGHEGRGGDREKRRLGDFLV